MTHLLYPDVDFSYTLRRIGLGEIVPVRDAGNMTVSMDKRGGLYTGRVVYTRDTFPSRHSLWQKLSEIDTSDVVTVSIPAAAKHVAIEVTAFTDTATPRLGAIMTVCQIGTHDSRFLRALGRRWDGHGSPMVDLSVLPNQAQLEYWYDFTDITTLFQDTAFATPVTADAQDIRSMHDKGPGARHLTEGASAGGTIIYNTAGVGGLPHGSFNSGGTVPRYLELDAASDIDLIKDYARAMITVFRWDDANSNGTIAQNGSTRYSNRVLSDALDTAVEGGLRELEASYAGARTTAVIMIHDGDDAVNAGEHQASGGTGVKTFDEQTSFLAGIDVFLGSSSNGNNEMDGAISEHAFWQAPTIAELPTMERLRLFVEEKYGLTF